MTSGNPFRYAGIIGAVASAGSIIELNLPVERFRWVWVFFQNDSFSAKGDECWLRFYRNGELTAELPTHVCPETNVHVKMSNSFNTAQASNASGAAVLWFSNADGGGYYAVQPFKMVVEADLVRLVTNKSGTTRALLAVLSSEQAS